MPCGPDAPFFILKHEALSQIAEQAATGGIKAVRLPAYLTPRRRQGVVAAIREGLAVLPGSVRNTTESRPAA